MTAISQRPSSALDERVIDAILELQVDPGVARFNTRQDVGGCLSTSRRFALTLIARGVEYEIRRYKSLPGWRTRVQHVVVVDGHVVDWIAPQYRPGPDWPDVRSVAEFEDEFGPPCLAICPRCGSPCDLGPDLRTIAGVSRRPLREHDCPGPDEQRHREQLSRMLDDLPPLQRAQVEQRMRKHASFHIEKERRRTQWHGHLSRDGIQV